MKTDTIETIVLIFCKTTDCNLIYCCTVKFDLIAQHPELTIDS